MKVICNCKNEEMKYKKESELWICPHCKATVTLTTFESSLKADVTTYSKATINVKTVELTERGKGRKLAIIETPKIVTVTFFKESCDGDMPRPQ